MDKANEFEFGEDVDFNSVYRFSEESNEQYRIPNELKVEEESATLKRFISHHSTQQVSRLNELERYYEGKNTTIFQRERRKEEYQADNRASHNFAEYITTFIQGYMVGVPLKTEYENELINEELQELNIVNDADELNSELVMDLSIYGRAYEMVFRNDGLKFAKLNVKNIFLIYDDSIIPKPLYGVRYFNDVLNDEVMHVFLYSTTMVYHYELDKNKKEMPMVLVEEEPHYFEGVPINEYENDSKRRGDFESILTLIDLYDSAQSDLANYSQDLNDAMFLIEGDVKMTPEQARVMKRVNTMILIPRSGPTGQKESVSGRYVYKKYDVAGMEAYKDRIMQDIFLISNVPNLLDESFSGNQSGEAIKMKLFGLSQKRATKERKFKKAIRRRYRLIAGNMERASETILDANKIKITFTENIPRALSQEVEWFAKLGGRLSDKTILSLLSFVDNPAKELEAIEREEEEQRNKRKIELDFENEAFNDYVGEEDE